MCRRSRFNELLYVRFNDSYVSLVQELISSTASMTYQLYGIGKESDVQTASSVIDGSGLEMTFQKGNVFDISFIA